MPAYAGHALNFAGASGACKLNRDVIRPLKSTASPGARVHGCPGGRGGPGRAHSPRSPCSSRFFSGTRPRRIIAMNHLTCRNPDECDTGNCRIRNLRIREGDAGSQHPSYRIYY